MKWHYTFMSHVSHRRLAPLIETHLAHSYLYFSLSINIMYKCMKHISSLFQTKQLSIGQCGIIEIVEKSFTLTWNSQYRRFQLKWLNFTSENLLNNGDCDRTKCAESMWPTWTHCKICLGKSFILSWNCQLHGFLLRLGLLDFACKNFSKCDHSFCLVSGRIVLYIVGYCFIIEALKYGKIRSFQLKSIFHIHYLQLCNKQDKSVGIHYHKIWGDQELNVLCP